MEQNEKDAVGARQPRGYVRYPFTNRHGAQGYTKYAPVAAAFEELLLVPQVATETVQIYLETNEELLRYLAEHPELLRDVSPRKFEEVVAAIFRNRGFSVEVTPRTRDGGRDILAVEHTKFGSSLNLVECKRYAQTRRVGVETVRGLYGVVTAENATRGVIVTTSAFTSVALDFASPLTYRLSLHDYDALKGWLQDFRRA
jgi:restriction endonuclease Mrr